MYDIIESRSGSPIKNATQNPLPRREIFNVERGEGIQAWPLFSDLEDSTDPMRSCLKKTHRKTHRKTIKTMGKPLENGDLIGKPIGKP